MLGRETRILKKILAVLLIVTLLFGALPTIAAADAESPDGGSGYIVELNDNAEDSVSLFAAEEPEAVHGLITVASESELQALIKSGCVRHYEPNSSVKLLGTVNDAYFMKQWNLRDINVEAAWDAGLLGSGATVAVIDSGINAQHEDFVGVSLLPGINVIDGSSDTDDELGHGTFVSGIIAAVRNNKVGIAGIADQVSLVPIKCFSDTEQASIFDICRGIYAAVDDFGCDVICLSLGTPNDSMAMEEAVDYAASKNVIVIAAVGNEGDTELFYPAAYDSVIGTASYDASGVGSSFSEKNMSVFISAPGSDISSTYIGSSSAYATADGTSFSAPHVAALAAVAKSYDPGMTLDEFKKLLIATSTDAGDTGYDQIYGYGKIDFGRFVTALLERGTGGSDAVEFEDTAGHWAEDAISACVVKGLFNGVSDTLFDPDGTMTRAMLVTVLYRYDNGALTAQADTGSGFSDVADPSAWYYEAVRWAAENGIVNGYEDGTFHLDASITREQLAAILYRYSGVPEEKDTAVLSVFQDYGSVSSYAAPAVAWGYKAGLIGGTGNSTLQPAGNATRAQVATIMMRYANLNK
jgi:subtilisin family serine protease